MNDELLAPDTVADVLDLDVKTLRRWRYQRQGPPYIRISHKTVRYPRSELDAWIDERKNATRSA